MLDQFFLLALAAGVLGFFAPCSVAMLPAYISYFLTPHAIGQDGTPESTGSIKEGFGGLGLLVVTAGVGSVMWSIESLDAVTAGFERLGARQAVGLVLGGLLVVLGFALAAPRSGVAGGINFGLITTGGIMAVFLALGLVIIGLLSLMSFRQLAVGVLVVAFALVAVGVLGLFGKDLAFTVPIKAPRRRNAVGFFAFGLAYGIVSLGCNVALFIVPIAGAIATHGTGGGLLAFAGYGLGSGLLMIVLAVGVASSRGLTADRVRRLLPFIRPVQNIVFIAVGLYIGWYYFRVLAPSAL